MSTIFLKNKNKLQNKENKSKQQNKENKNKTEIVKHKVINGVCNCENCVINGFITESKQEIEADTSFEEYALKMCNKMLTQAKNGCKNGSKIPFKTIFTLRYNTYTDVTDYLIYIEQYYDEISKEIFNVLSDFLYIQVMELVKYMVIAFEKNGSNFLLLKEFKVYSSFGYLTEILKRKQYLYIREKDSNKHVESVHSLDALFFNDYILEYLKYYFEARYRVLFEYRSNKKKTKNFLMTTIRIESKLFKEAYKSFDRRFGDRYTVNPNPIKDDSLMQKIIQDHSFSSLNCSSSSTVEIEDVKEEEVCPICLDEDNLKQLNCCFQFIHSDCLNDYLSTQKSKNKSCPLCRQQPSIKN
jgi:hypothetical protein